MKRLLSLLLALVLTLGMLPIGTLAASSEEEALGEINIYNGNYELGYLSINGVVRKQKYTYYNYQGADGTTQEIPAKASSTWPTRKPKTPRSCPSYSMAIPPMPTARLSCPG